MTTFLRTTVSDFALANPIYARASVTFWAAPAGVKTATKATLYDAVSGTGTLPNPQRLDSKGKLKQITYFAEAVIAEVDGTSFPGHDTGVMRPNIDDSDIEAAEDSANIAYHQAQAARREANNAAASAAAAAASAAAITLPLPVASGGTGSSTQPDARTNLGLGTAAVLDAGTASGNVPILNASGDIPYAEIPDEVADAANLAMFALAR